MQSVGGGGTAEGEEPAGETPTVPPEVCSSRSVAIFRADGEALVAEARISRDGRYRVSLAPGTCVVDIARNRMDRADGLPKTMVIENRKTVQLSVDVDTGIRRCRNPSTALSPPLAQRCRDRVNARTRAQG